MRIWQVAGREDELPETGDWKVYSIFDQSFIIVRGSDGELRGFVNACRHRGNALCAGNGHASRFTCPYHLWSYGLDGDLLAAPRPDFEGSIEAFVGPKEELSLIAVPVACFAGFIFLNPDPHAAPLGEFLGEMADVLAPYHIEGMVPVGLHVREAVECNWKVVTDAFQEGYHIPGTHPELIGSVDLAKERCTFFGDHAVATVPFGGPHLADLGFEEEAEAIRALPPANFPGLAAVLPRFEELVGSADRSAEVTARALLQRAMRETLTQRGLDVSSLTDNQMSDYLFCMLFPNVFLQLIAGEATVIMALPDPGGDPNKCLWQVSVYLWLPPEQRKEQRAELVEVADGDHFPYFLALEQDFHQMQRQQTGLRNEALGYMNLTKQELRVAHYHWALDSWVGGPTRS
jgi:phenylpropionate dioxygenase-like ring-hydroxylating dioxygenase large terminal subunit